MKNSVNIIYYNKYKMKDILVIVIKSGYILNIKKIIYFKNYF